MTIITAKAEIYNQTIEVTIKGDKYVDSIECDDLYIQNSIADMIKKGEGYMANGYHPEPNTMLQAFATTIQIFEYDKVKVEGELDEIPYKTGVIY